MAEETKSAAAAACAGNTNNLESINKGPDPASESKDLTLDESLMSADESKVHILASQARIIKQVQADNAQIDKVCAEAEKKLKHVEKWV